MIPENLKRPPTVSVEPSEVSSLDKFLKELPAIPSSDGTIQVIFSERQFILARTICTTFLWIISLLSFKKIGVGVIRKVLKINYPPASPSENESKKKDNNLNPINNGDGTEEDKGESDSLITDENSGFEDPSVPPTPPDHRPNHHGRRNSDDLKVMNYCDHYHPELKHNDPCPEEGCNGRVYLFLRDGELREVVTFNFAPPFQATVNRMHDLRCNNCLKVFKALPPNDLIRDGALTDRYLYPAQAALVILHFGMGFPMYRMDQFQSLVGERFPESTQFDILEGVADVFHNFTKAMKVNAANGFLFQGDDVTNRIQDLIPELRERRSDGQLVFREGVHTSILISSTPEGNLIPVLKTGIIHFGEHLDDVLSKRSLNLPPPYLVCDASKVNQAFVMEPIKGGCWQHSREYFIKALKNFPVEVRPIVSLFKDIFRIDRETHVMNAEQRLKHLQIYGLPIVKSIKNAVEIHLLNKTALPKSELGVALRYFFDQYKNLLLPFEHQGIPIHNNLSEWCTYLVVRYLVNSKFFRNNAGAAIGDVLTMVILFCYLSSVNPYDNILYCLQHKDELKKNPENFFPWKLRDNVKAMPEHKQMKFWTPAPPLKLYG